MSARLAGLAARVRADGYRLDRVLCFSGLNLVRGENGGIGILAQEPFSGNGDIGFFEIVPRTRFVHNARFEEFDHAGGRRDFGDFAYWHMKYLKPGFGFSNRDLEAGNPRFARKYQRVLNKPAAGSGSRLAQ